MKVIKVQNQSGTPKYRQIILSVEIAIAEQRLRKGDRLPSVNKVCLEYSLSRDTVLLAYNELKKRGIIYAFPGKGYYVKSVEFTFEQRIFLLFDELNSFKEDIYSAFQQTMNGKAQIDIFFHHFNIRMFRKLINESNGNYFKYIIMPTNLEGAADVIKSLPRNDVFILDQTNAELAGYPSVHQNFVRDIYNALVAGRQKLEKYDKLVLIFPGFREPYGMVEGFRKFCSDFSMDAELIEDFGDRQIANGEVFIIPNDRHLVDVIERSKEQHLLMGKDFGVISYNDTPLKKVVGNGITTISTDFSQMGSILAEMILGNSREQVENTSALIMRNSL
jgi:DNA-binding transcriptional regulator YhcF (GntR family)